MELKGISVSFSGARALDGASLSLRKGEIHAVLGENGAGKTTLARVMAGLCPPDQGEILFDGQDVTGYSPVQAIRLGIGMAFGLWGQIDGFSVLEHLYLANRSGLSKRALRAKAEELGEKYHISLDLKSPMGDLLPDQRLRADILRMLLADCEVLIFDEPDVLLSLLEMDALRSLWQTFKNEGKTVVFFTRRVDSALTADRCTVLRGGVTAEPLETAACEKETLLRMMAGKKEALPLERRDISVGGMMLEIRDLTVRKERKGPAVLRRASLEARSAEITAVLGLPGDELPLLAEAIAGLVPVSGGRIRLRGQEINALSSRERARAGIGYLPGPEAAYGIAEGFSLAENAVLRRYREGMFQESGLLKRGDIRRHAEKLQDDVGIGQEIRTGDSIAWLPEGEVRLLALEREIERNGDILMAVEPAQGMSNSVALAIHERLLSVRDNRRAVLFLTTDVEEALQIADRIIVLCQGETVGEFLPAFTTARELGLYRSGGRRQGEEEPLDEE